MIDTDDHEYLQGLSEKSPAPPSRADESGSLDSVFSPGFSSCVRSEMYRAWVYPEIYPEQPQPRLVNWHPEDLVMFCGIYPKGSA